MAERTGKIILMEDYRAEGGEGDKHKIQFEGFVNPDHRKFVETRIQAIGLPTDNIRTLRFINADSYTDSKRRWFVLGHYDYEKGEYALYKPWQEKLPEVAQLGTMVHELGHADSPLRKENTQLFGTEEKREEARKHAETIAQQTLETRVFLNPYHKKLAEMLKAGQIDKERFVEETNAIMIELRFTNVAHLRQVERSQHERAKIRGFEAISIVDGIDQTLITLTSRNHPEIKTVKDLDRHIATVRTNFSNSVTERETLPKAA